MVADRIHERHAAGSGERTPLHDVADEFGIDLDTLTVRAAKLPSRRLVDDDHVSGAGAFDATSTALS